MEKRTSAAKAGDGSVIYGTAEAVPFHKDCVLTQTLKPWKLSSDYGTAEAVPFHKDCVLTQTLKPVETL